MSFLEKWWAEANSIAYVGCIKEIPYRHKNSKCPQ
jgi:hypothetical protein